MPRKKKADLRIYGTTGLKHYDGYIDEEWHAKLSTWEREYKVYSEMRDNDPIVGAMLHGIESLIRGLDWHVKPAGDSEKALEAARFLEECLDDMSNTWGDFISEVMTMLPYGFSYFEVLYKIRRGHSKNPNFNSRYEDNRVGWRMFAPRGQETLDRWEIDSDGGILGMHQSGLPDYTPRYVPMEKALLYRTRTTRNNPQGRSILRNAYRSWYFLRRIQEIEAIGIERDLAGLPVMQVPPRILSTDADSGDATLRADLENLVQQIRRDERAGILMPSETDPEGRPTGYKLSLLTTGGSRQIATDEVVKRYESRIAMSTFTEFVTLGADGGSSSSLVGNKMKMFQMSLGSLVDNVKSVFNRFAVNKLFMLNPEFNQEDWPKVDTSPIDTPQLEEMSNFLNRMVMAGLITPDKKIEDHLRAMSRLPKADPDIRATGMMGDLEQMEEPDEEEETDALQDS